MLKKLLNNIFSKETSLECKVDEDKVDCKELGEEYEHINDDFQDGWWLLPEYQDGYTGVPVPPENVIDEWFADRSGEVIVKDQEVFAGNYQGPLYAPYTAVDEFKKESIGDDGMHQKMYDIATQSGKTTVQLNPIGGSENFQGGSENVHR